MHDLAKKPITMTSLEIAELLGKGHRHFHVLRDIETILYNVGIDASKFGCLLVTTNNREVRGYELPEKLVLLVTSKYSDKQRYILINELERKSLPSDRERWESALNERMYLQQPIKVDNYFCVFTESTGFVTDMVLKGFEVNDRNIVDNSIGSMWGKHWLYEIEPFAIEPRIKAHHVFPASYKQKSVVDAWFYPNRYLGDFRTWLETTYRHKHFPKYLKTKVKKGDVAKICADNLKIKLVK